MKENWIFRIALMGLIVTFMLGCQPKTELYPGEGYVNVKGGKVWYKIVGGGSEIPLVLLHGGPGFPSYYLNPFAELSDERPIIFLDQFGCGRSDDNKDTTLMTIETFVEQLEQFVDSLGLIEFHLYGHSWGTMLGMDYYLQYPDRVKSLTFASPCLSLPRWADDCKVLIKTLPDSIQLAIETNEESGNYESAEYQNAMNVFYQNFVARKIPWDANIDSTFAGANVGIYNYMWGPSEFTPTGTLQNYDRTDKLKDVKVPSLYMCGEFDEARPRTAKYFQNLTPGSKFVMIEDAAHISMHDNPEQTIQELNTFLKEIEDK
jgi:proline iminopeptidase